ncbi:hypothetical protein J2S55_002092 [Streptosporangium brasiliense]|uniref:Uncharacterized protein n=1 Tax=Streptosporangium brasiliense TaxID=47480 RepID=A0ABT9R0T2_9ACTN|nr:hypothetical protein [Streptosporangium brasiliense]
MAWVDTSHTTRPEGRATTVAGTADRERSSIPGDSLHLRSNNLMILRGEKPLSISQAGGRLTGDRRVSEEGEDLRARLDHAVHQQVRPRRFRILERSPPGFHSRAVLRC